MQMWPGLQLAVRCGHVGLDRAVVTAPASGTVRCLQQGGALTLAARGGSCPGVSSASACPLPPGEQPDASLPMHVLPLYSLLAPEKQAQVQLTVPLDPVLGWGLGSAE